MKHLVHLFFLAAFVACWQDASAQCTFINATHTEAAFNANTYSNVQWTGNDVKVYGGTKVEVSVWDGDAQGFGWRFGTGTGELLLPTTVNDPDVALVPNGTSDLYALVVYIDNSNGNPYFTVYEWNGTTFVVNTNPTAFSTAVYPQYINADGTNAGQCAVIWDDAGNAGNLNLRAGNAGASNIVWTNIQTAPNTASAFAADIAFYTGTTSTFVNYSYVTSTGALEVGSDLFATLNGGGTISNTSPYSSSIANTNYDHPRIACLQTTSTPAQTNLWCVGVIHQNTNTWTLDIATHTLWNGSTTVNVHTDGNTTGLCNVSADYSRFPAITACEGRGYFVGWTSGFTGSVNFTNWGLIGIDVLYNGTYYNPGGTPGYKELYTANSSGNQETKLSLAGRDFASSPYFLCTFSDPVLNDVMHKWVDWTSASARETEATLLAPSVVYPNPAYNTVSVVGLTNTSEVEVADVAGKVLIRQTVAPGEVLDVAALEPGLYLLRTANGVERFVKR